MRHVVWAVIGVLIGAALAITAIGLVGYLSGTRTEYCPFSHQISDSSSCVVLDSEGDRVLIQHADLDTGECYLEIWTPESQLRFPLPAGISRLAPEGYTASLIASDSSAILINDQRYVFSEAPQPRH